MDEQLLESLLYQEESETLDFKEGQYAFNKANHTQKAELLKDILATCQGSTKFCVAADITAANEYIVTKTISDWKKQPLPELHKRPAIFLIGK